MAGVIVSSRWGEKVKRRNRPFSEFLGALKNGAIPVLDLSRQHQNGRVAGSATE